MPAHKAVGKKNNFFIFFRLVVTNFLLRSFCSGKTQFLHLCQMRLTNISIRLSVCRGGPWSDHNKERQQQLFMGAAAHVVLCNQILGFEQVADEGSRLILLLLPLSSRTSSSGVVRSFKVRWWNFRWQATRESFKDDEIVRCHVNC